MTEIHDRESALSRDLAGLNCALVKIVDADDRYYVLVGEPELYRDGFRLETSGARKSRGRPPPRPSSE